MPRTSLYRVSTKRTAATFQGTNFERYSKTWVGRSLKAITTRSDHRLLKLASSDDHYYTRLFATARILEQGIRVTESIKNFELSQVTNAYKLLEENDFFTAFSNFPVVPNAVCNPAIVLNLEEEMAKLLPFLVERKIAGEQVSGKWWQVRRWDKRTFSASSSSNLSLTIAKGGYQPVRAIALWQFVYDLYQIREKIKTWEKDPQKAIDFLIGQTLETWHVKNYQRLLNALGKHIRKVTPGNSFGPDEIETSKKVLEALPGLASEINRNCPTRKVAILLTGDGNITLGHNGPPTWPYFSGCSEIQSGCIRINPIMPNQKGTLNDIRDNRPDLRRSICAEQRAILWAQRSGFNLNGSILFLTGPCNQCGEMFIQAGGRTLFTTGEHKDANTESIYKAVNANIFVFPQHTIKKIVIPA